MTHHTTQQELTQHWAMDEAAAHKLTPQLSRLEQAIISTATEMITPTMAETRDINRKRITTVFGGAGSMAVLGMCSMDHEAKLDELFEFLGEVQQEHPDTVVATRINGSKPRSGKGWRGQAFDLDGNTRQALIDTNIQALAAGLPVITEITDAPQLGMLAPFLSAMWLGARDMDSTALRHAAHLIKLPTGIKNGMTGSCKNVNDAIETIRSNSAQNDNSGVNVGSIASSAHLRGVATGVLPVASGNPNVAIFARGYELPAWVNATERRRAAIEHLSMMCVLAADQDCAVLIDGTHSVAPMFDIERKDPDRFLFVLDEIHQAISKGEVRNAERIRGVIGEVGMISGRTDPNFIVDARGKRLLKNILKRTLELIDENA